MQCPKCQSGNVQLCSMAYEQGTTTTTTSGTATGHSMGSSTQGGFGVAQHNIQTSSTGTTRTPFAKRAAPPTNWFGIWATQAVTAGIGAVVVYFAHSLLQIIGVLEIVFVPWLLIALIGVALTYHKRQRYADAQARWRASWICVACGNKFVPND